MGNLATAFSFKWTTWGQGSPEEERKQVIAEQTNISLVSALVLSVAVTFLGGIFIPDGTGVYNFPLDKLWIDWFIIDCLTLSFFGFLFGAFCSVIILMGVNEVGTAVNVQILHEWVGDWSLLVPVLFFQVAMISFYTGMLLWVLTIQEMGGYFYTLIGFVGIVVGLFVFWVLNVVSSVWLTLAHGEETLEKGYAKECSIQSIDVAEISDELDRYIEDCHGIENTNPETFLLRLRVIDPDESTVGEADEDIIKLGQVTETIARDLFKAKLDECVENSLAARTELREDSKKRSSKANSIVLNRAKDIATKSSNYLRTVVYDDISEQEEERAWRIRMSESQRIAPLGPVATFAHYFCLTDFLKRNGFFPEWFDTNGKYKGWLEYHYKFPINWTSLMIIWYFFTFDWLTWGRHPAEEMKRQVTEEQTNIAIATALLLTVAASATLSVVTPDEMGVTNFPAEKQYINMCCMNALAMSSLLYILSCFASVILSLAVNEVGDAENVPVLMAWLGKTRNVPIWLFLFGFGGVCFGFFYYIFSMCRPTGYMHAFLGATIFVVAISFTFVFKITTSVWLTLACGEDTLTKGYAKHLMTQSISMDELQYELDTYIQEAHGVENINLETFKLRLSMLDPDKGKVGEKGETVIKLGQVTDKIATRLFEETVEGCVNLAFNGT